MPLILFQTKLLVLKFQITKILQLHTKHNKKLDGLYNCRASV